MKIFGPLLLQLLLALPAAGSDLVVTDLRLVDPLAREVRPASLRLVGARIAGEGPVDGSGFDPAIDRWSADGRFAVPGMLDASAFAATQVSPGHRDSLSVADARALFLAAGVHAVVDLGGRSGSTRVLAGGPVLVVAGGVAEAYPGAVTLEDAVQAREVVERLVAGPDAPGRLSVILDRGRRRRALATPVLGAALGSSRGLPVAVYVGTWHDAAAALEAGANWLVQIPPGPPPESVLDLVRRNRPAWTPAIAVSMDFMALMAEPELRAASSLARSLPEEMRADYAEVRVPQSRLTEARLQNEDRLAAVRALHEAGAVLVAGSQSGGLGTAHGWTFLRELHWWRQAGIDAWDILAGAALHGRARMGLAAGFAAGGAADFTLYADDPVEDVGALSRPEFVFVDGERREPDALVAAVRHTLIEQAPANPLPGGNRWSMLIIAVVGFTVLLGLRHLVRKAAASAG